MNDSQGEMYQKINDMIYESLQKISDIILLSKGNGLHPVDEYVIYMNYLNFIHYIRINHLYIMFAN